MIKDHRNRGFLIKVWDGLIILFKVEIKLNDAIIELIPARCREKIVRSTAGPMWYGHLARGGYTVHPVPAPPSMKPPLIMK